MGAGFPGDQKNARALQTLTNEMLEKNGLNRLPILRTAASTAFMTWREMCPNGLKAWTRRVASR